jgi:hypothetical protein
MSLRRYLPRIVIAAAAAASIATSAITYSLEETVALEPVVLDAQAPTSTYAIQATVETGEDSPEPRSGEVMVSFDLSGRVVPDVMSSQVEVELRSAAREDEVARELFTVPSGGRVSGHLTLEAWAGCASRSCIEDFTLTVRLLPAADRLPVDVTGSVHAQFSAFDSREPPPGSDIVIDVTPLGPVP